MIGRNRTYRVVDGETIPGTWRHIFIRNGRTYFLADLFVYADGMIDCWGPVDLEGLRDKISSGWVATSFEAGGHASAHLLAYWQFAEPHAVVDGDALIGEVVDLIEELNDRPTSSRKCQLAIEQFLDDQTEENRLAIRDAYYAIPDHHRVFVLGDQDHRDRPVLELITDIGQRIPDTDDVATDEVRASAISYFESSRRSRDEYAAQDRDSADGPAEPDDPTLTVEGWMFPSGDWPGPPHPVVLANHYPATVELDDHRYPTAHHAYWSLATLGEEAEAVAKAPSPYEAQQLALTAPRPDDWPLRRTAVMHRVLSAKFAQHPEIADYLVSTGSGRIVYPGAFESPFWSSRGDRGRNWIGRLLELVRSELADARASGR